jgi:preprotein translocase subunit SecG
MQIWMTLILAVQLLSALAMIGLVLIQHGKGADMGASFGSGASGSLFGATGSANFLSRSTAACATVFFLCTLALTYLGSAGRTADSGRSVLDGAPVQTAPAASSAALPAGPASAATGVPAPMSNPVPAPIPATPAPAASK